MCAVYELRDLNVLQLLLPHDMLLSCGLLLRSHAVL
jgi:hypothetical protein